MGCCVPFCKNTQKNVSNLESLTFHFFPTELPLRNAWLRALGKQDSQVQHSAVVCSQHFLIDDIYVSECGQKQIRCGAIPSIVQVCMICLDTDRKLCSMSKYKLIKAYENLIGYSLYDQGNLKETLCLDCAQILINFSKFREKSLTARSLMLDLVQKHELITLRHIKMLNRVKSRLNSNIVKANLEPDSSDLYVRHPDVKEETDLEDTPQTEVNVVVVNEPILVDNEHVEPKVELTDDYDDPVALDEGHVTDPSQMLEALKVANVTEASDTQLFDKNIYKMLTQEHDVETAESIKSENITFECTVCFEGFTDEDTYNEHVMTHFEQSDERGLCKNQLERPAILSKNPTKRRSRDSGHNSPRTTDNQQPILRSNQKNFDQFSSGHTQILDIRCTDYENTTEHQNTIVVEVEITHCTKADAYVRRTGRKRPKTPAERMREYRARKKGKIQPVSHVSSDVRRANQGAKTDNDIGNPESEVEVEPVYAETRKTNTDAKHPKTAAERMREYRARKKIKF